MPMSMNNRINDEIAIRIYELLLDKYYFNDVSPKIGNKLVDEGFTSLDIAVRKDFKNAPKKEIIKVIAVLRFVALRRTKNGREYMSVVEHFVGEDMGKVKLSPFNLLFRKLKDDSTKLLK